LSIYSRYLEALAQEGVKIIASDKLAPEVRHQPGPDPQGPAYFGEFGIRGVGYFVKELLFEIRRILASTRSGRWPWWGSATWARRCWPIKNFIRQGYEFVAVFDTDPAKVGRRLPSGQIIYSVEDLEQVVTDKGVEIGVIATPRRQGPDGGPAPHLLRCQSHPQFCPHPLQVPEGMAVENVDFTVKLDNLAYKLTMGEG